MSCYSLEESGPPSTETEGRPALSPVLEARRSRQSLGRVVLFVQMFNCNLGPLGSCSQREVTVSHYPTVLSPPSLLLSKALG